MLRKYTYNLSLTDSNLDIGLDFYETFDINMTFVMNIFVKCTQINDL